MNLYIIGGSPCAGKSTVAELLAGWYGLHYFRVDDRLDAYIRKGADRAFPICQKQSEWTAEQIFMRDPVLQCEEELLFYEETFPFVCEDLERISSGQDIITEGAAYLPGLMKKRGILKERYLSLTPKPEFQVSHFRKREWVFSHILAGCSDSERAFMNWMQRDILFADKVRQQCERTGYSSWINRGEIPAKELAEKVAIHFGLKR
ncbi:MAG: hypothetical protein HFG27_00710 [Provencibacterium sp.]|jgi:hypothetical protein|nr:hypothetical protein [Provencibacterium sp.]